MVPGRLERGCSLDVVPPDLMLWSDASDEGWGAHLGDRFVSGLWSQTERELSINLRELKAIHLRPSSFRRLSPRQVSSGLLRQCVSRSLSEEPGRHGLLAVERGGPVYPQMGGGSGPQDNAPVYPRVSQRPSRRIVERGPGDRVRVDPSSRRSRPSPKGLAATVDLFATSLNYRLPVYFAPLVDPMSAGTDGLLQPWSSLDAYAFPPFTLVRQVLNKVRASSNLQFDSDRSFLASEGVVPRLAGVVGGTTPSVTTKERSSQTAPLSQVPSGAPVATPSCLETIQRFVRHEGLLCSSGEADIPCKKAVH